MKNSSFPTLFSRNSNGSVQQWTISVRGSTITRVYGQTDGKLQTTTDTIKTGKSLGRSNETTASEQAVCEATSQWEKKLKSGYVQSLTGAKSGKVDKNFVTGGVEPMLAQKWRDHSAKIEFPAFVQPKLDGIRCIAIINNGSCTLWSRTRKPIKSVPHIVEALEKMLPNETVVLDGELYNHDLRDQFEEIVSLVRKDKPDPRCGMVQYHVYDVVSAESSFEDRNKWLWENVAAKTSKKSPIRYVATEQVDEFEDTIQFFTEFRAEGYEGAMIRNANSLYENRRSYNLQKIKEFDDAEYLITGVEAGRGRCSECAIFVCETKKGEEFRCKMEGSLDILKGILKAPKKVVGKKLTVRYQGITNGGVPRFPVGVVVRDYE